MDKPAVEQAAWVLNNLCDYLRDPEMTYRAWVYDVLGYEDNKAYWLLMAAVLETGKLEQWAYLSGLPALHKALWELQEGLMELGQLLAKGARMGEARWKTVQRNICRLFGGESTGVTGKRGPDCTHSWLAIQAKGREQAIPKYLRKWLDQAVRDADGGHLPIVVWHVIGEEYLDAPVIVPRVRDFLDYFGNGDAAQAAVGGAEELPFTDL